VRFGLWRGTVEKVADLKELSDGLAVVAGNARREVLGRFDSSGGSLDGKAGNGDGRSRAARIRVQNLVVDDNALRGIGRRDRRRRSDNSNRLVDGGELSGCAPLCVIKLFCSGGVSRFLVGSWWVLIAPKFGETRPARAELIFSGRGRRLT
jgi:hypothetical protein